MQNAARTIEECDPPGPSAAAAVVAPPHAPLAMPVQDLGVGGPPVWNRAWRRVRGRLRSNG